MEFVFAAVNSLITWGDIGACVTLRIGDAWFADDPFVKARPDLFSSTPLVVHGTQGQEQPAATPLEQPRRRGRGRG